MRIFLKCLFILLSLATGALFLYSAYTKSYPIQSFEYTMVEFAHLPRTVAVIAARFFIGLEGGLGILIALHFFGKRKWVLKTSLWLLVIFSLYLVYLWTTAGNNVNCGCFGDAIWMSPSTSLLKNAFMIAILGVLIRYHKGFERKAINISSPVIVAATIVSMFIVYPMGHYKIDFSQVGLAGGPHPHAFYAPGSTDTLSGSNMNLHKGKYIVAFLSQSCSHCRKTATLMHELKQSNPDLPFFMIIGGESELADFWEATHATNIPYVRLSKEPFLKYTGGVFPVILWINDGWVEENVNYHALTKQAIAGWQKEN